MKKMPEPIIVSVDPDLLEIIPQFFAFRRKDLEMIGLYLEQDQFEKLRVIGHNLKGAGGGYGFEGISSIGHRLEVASVGRKKEDIDACAVDLADYLDRVEIKLG